MSRRMKRRTTFVERLATMLTAEPWTPTEASMHAATAKVVMRHDKLDHNDSDVRDNCTACALAENCPDTSCHRPDLAHPRHCEWERIYVEAGRPIPQRYLAAFCETLGKKTPYAKALHRSVRTFGLKVAYTATLDFGKDGN